jgi:hypothetical protein
VDDQELIRRFEDGTLAETGLHHADHVRLAWLYLSRQPLLPALERFTSGLKRFAAAAGKIDRYHETITWAWLLLIHERMERAGRPPDWRGFITANADLLDREKGVLTGYYKEDTLASELARRVFVLPDRGFEPGRRIGTGAGAPAPSGAGRSRGGGARIRLARRSDVAAMQAPHGQEGRQDDPDEGGGGEHQDGPE